MRIVGSIPHPRLKITVFKMNDRLSVKLESGLYEQTYKFRQGSGVDRFEDIQTLLAPGFLEAVERDLERMHARVMEGLHKQDAPEKEAGADEFDLIL